MSELYNCIVSHAMNGKLVIARPVEDGVAVDSVQLTPSELCTYLHPPLPEERADLWRVGVLIGWAEACPVDWTAEG